MSKRGASTDDEAIPREGDIRDMGVRSILVYWPHLNAVSKGYNVDLAGERTHIPRRWQFARRVAGGIASCWSCAGFR